MFEFCQYDSKLRHNELSCPLCDYIPVEDVSHLSLLIWGEHCIECGAPDCFKTCDLYQARPDARCRRFEFGIYRNTSFPSLRHYGAEVNFKKWAKLEARGNTRMEGLHAIALKEKLVEFIAPPLNIFGSILFRITKDIRWRYLGYALTERFIQWYRPRVTSQKYILPPDAFLLEVFNPGNATIKMQLSFSINRQREGFASTIYPFIETLTFNPGYSRHEVKYEKFRDFIGHAYDIALTPEADTFPHMIFLMADFVVFRKKPSMEVRKSIKCVVWDLDNTLWKGILSEGDKVSVNGELVDIIKELDRRGILNSIASKNDSDHAWPVLQKLGISEYFLFPQINWSPKSENIKEIAKDFNIGLDAFAFIDDNPFELEQVAGAIPEITCVNVQDIDHLLQDSRFKGGTSEEAKNRRHSYLAESRRREDKKGYGENYFAFLKSCEIVLDIRHLVMDDFERVAELVQRTNQLNFSGHKYTRSELACIIEDPGMQKFVLTCSDNYGSYGTVGFALVQFEEDVIRVRDLMLSCRVQGKFIEKAFFGFLLAYHKGSSSQRVWVHFNQTARNQPSGQVLESLQFCRIGGQSGIWSSKPGMTMACDFMKVNAPRV